MTPEISVVIPTYDRLDVLPEVLGGLDAQEGAPAFEVLVVDDGSTDGTLDWLANGSLVRVPMRVLRQAHQLTIR